MSVEAVVMKVVEKLLPTVIGLIGRALSRSSDQQLAMLLLADRLKLRAYAQAKLDTRRKK